jgi:uncharacterized protein (TIGR02246 family)
MKALTDPATIEGCLARMQQAWNDGDAAAFASEFTDDASYVIFAGIISLGRAAIERDHEPVLQKWQRGSHMAMKVIEIREVAPGVAVAVTEGGVGKGARIPLNKVQTFVLVREGGVWKCAAFQNTKKNGLFIRMNALFDRR